MKRWTRDDMYEDGAAYASEVQEALSAGATFDENGHLVFEDGGVATTPENAAQLRDLYREDGNEYATWWDGYVSRWD